MPRKPRTTDPSTLTFEAVFPSPRPSDLLALAHEARGTREPTRSEWEALSVAERARLVKKREAETAAAIREQEERNEQTARELRGAPPTTPPTENDPRPWSL